MTARPIIATDPETGIPDLIRRLSEDSRRLVSDEARLAKLEAADSIKRATKGVLWLALAFGATVVMLTSLTVFLSTLIGRLVNGHMWVGALVTGVVELGMGAWLVKRGLAVYAKPSYTLAETRGALRDTTARAADVRA